jgi:hypothetical protein
MSPDSPQPKSRQEDLGSELEGQRKEAGEIVQRWFRFRARRGVGIFYLLVSLAPVVGTILGDFFKSSFLGIAGPTIMVVLAWSFGRMAGAQSFSKMRKAVRLLKEDSSIQSSRLRSALPFAILFWPWIAYAAADQFGLPTYEIFFALVWLVEIILYRALIIPRNESPIIEQRAEDWLATIAVPIIAIIPALGSLHILPSLSLSLFLLLTPLFLIAGLKSLYEAPKELVKSLGE